MKPLKILIISKKNLYIGVCIAVILFVAAIHFAHLPAAAFVDSKNQIIVIDAGHGGIDGGTNKDGLLEKEVNLDIALRLKTIMELKGYTVVMTRNEDISLDSQDHSSTSRQKRDLNARVNIINSSNAQLFISIHVNCMAGKPTTDGSIVFYRDKYQQSKTLAYSIQRSLNNMTVNGKARTIHDPAQGDYYILNNSNVPGVIVETAFISNGDEKKLLATDEFRKQLASSIADGVDKYLNDK